MQQAASAPTDTKYLLTFPSNALDHPDLPRVRRIQTLFLNADLGNIVTKQLFIISEKMLQILQPKIKPKTNFHDGSFLLWTKWRGQKKVGAKISPMPFWKERSEGSLVRSDTNHATRPLQSTTSSTTQQHSTTAQSVQSSRCWVTLPGCHPGYDKATF